MPRRGTLRGGGRAGAGVRDDRRVRDLVQRIRSELGGGRLDASHERGGRKRALPQPPPAVPVSLRKLGIHKQPAEIHVAGPRGPPTETERIVRRAVVRIAERAIHIPERKRAQRLPAILRVVIGEDIAIHFLARLLPDLPLDQRPPVHPLAVIISGRRNCEIPRRERCVRLVEIGLQRVALRGGRRRIIDVVNQPAVERDRRLVGRLVLLVNKPAGDQRGVGHLCIELLHIHAIRPALDALDEQVSPAEIPGRARAVGAGAVVLVEEHLHKAAAPSGIRAILQQHELLHGVVAHEGLVRHHGLQHPVALRRHPEQRHLFVIVHILAPEFQGVGSLRITR